MANDTTEKEYIRRVALQDVRTNLNGFVFPMLLVLAEHPCVCKDIGMIIGNCAYCQARTFFNCLVTELQLKGFRG